jgi:hypothetical protein
MRRSGSGLLSGAGSRERLEGEREHGYKDVEVGNVGTDDHRRSSVAIVHDQSRRGAKFANSAVADEFDLVGSSVGQVAAEAHSTGQVAGQAGSIRPGAVDPDSFDHPETRHPRRQTTMPVRRRRERLDPQQPAVHVDHRGDVHVAMRVHPTHDMAR